MGTRKGRRIAIASVVAAGALGGVVVFTGRVVVFTGRVVVFTGRVVVLAG